MERLKQSARQAISETGIYLGIFAAVITIVGVIGFENLVESQFMRFIIAVAIFIIAYTVAFLKCFFLNKVDIHLGDSRKVTVEFGVVFDKTGVIVIPFNRYFDTVVDGNILNERAVVSQFIKKEYAGNLGELDSLIEKGLNGVEHIEVHDNKNGKKVAYPIGTTLKISKGANDYFCVALTDVDPVSSKSQCDIEMLHKSLICLLHFINKEANGKDVYMPLLGAGFSRLNKDKQIILDYLISVFRMSDIPLQSKLHIILLESERECFDLTKQY